MRLFLIENYESKEYDDWNSDEMMERIKADCSKFITEFIQKGHYVYRGLDELSRSKAYLVPTKHFRLAHGHTFHNSQLAHSFDRYLEQNHIGSRYRYSASTTTTHPKSYHGVIVDAWYYFIPKGNYQYHYHKGVRSDFNMVTLDTAVGGMKSVNRPLTKIMTAYEELYYKDIFDLDKDSPMALVFDEDKLANLFRTLKEMVDAMINLYQDTNHRKINKLSNQCVDEVESLAHAFKNSSDSTMQSASISFTQMYQNMKLLPDVERVVDDFLASVVSNKHGEHMDENEVVFTCKSYYAIPHNDEGKEFLEKLKK